jgi:hypothetical protein
VVNRWSLAKGISVWLFRACTLASPHRSLKNPRPSNSTFPKRLHLPITAPISSTCPDSDCALDLVRVLHTHSPDNYLLFTNTAAERAGCTPACYRSQPLPTSQWASLSGAHPPSGQPASCCAQCLPPARCCCCGQWLTCCWGRLMRQWPASRRHAGDAQCSTAA